MDGAKQATCGSPSGIQTGAALRYARRELFITLDDCALLAIRAAARDYLQQALRLNPQFEPLQVLIAKRAL